MTVTAHPPEDILAAVAVIHDVVFDQRPHDEHTVATAHNTLTRRRHHLAGPLRAAVDRYLDDDTYHHGPHLLRHAVHRLGHHVGIADHDTAHIAEQPALF